MKQKLENSYVQDYYDAHVGKLDETYEQSRWHASIAGEFDYRQTSRALDRALGTRVYDTAIEIGPGDGVWTKKLETRVSGALHLVEQSQEMLEQAKQRLRDNKDITFEQSDWMGANPPEGVDLIFAIRCFEYFSDKQASLLKMFNALRPGGRLILVTKNADLYTTANVQGRTLHSDQVTKQQMEALLANTGFSVRCVYPATFRWKVKYALMRIFFDTLHRFLILTKGVVPIPILEKYATESYVYVASRPKI